MGLTAPFFIERDAGKVAGAALTIVLVRGTSLDSAASAVAASVAALRLGMSQGGIISLSPAGQIGGEHCVDQAQLKRRRSGTQTLPF